MYRVYNTNTGETICTVEANHSMTIEEMLEFAGAERITEDHPAYDPNECGNYFLDGKEIWVEELDVETCAAPWNRVKALREGLKMSRRAFSEKFGIPQRTIENWEYGINEAPDYVINLLETVIEYERREEKKEMRTYKIYWVGGDRDGELLHEIDADGKNPGLQAQNWAKEFWNEHENEFDPVCGGVMIQDPDGNVYEW